MRKASRPALFALCLPFSLSLCTGPSHDVPVSGAHHDCVADGDPVPVSAVAEAESALVMVRATVPYPNGSGMEDREIFGFGTVIDHRGRVVTPFHVIRNARSIRVVPMSLSDGVPRQSGDPIEARALFTSPELDGAVLQPIGRGPNVRPLPLELDMPRVGQPVFVLQGTVGWQTGFIRDTDASPPPKSGLIEVNVATSRGDSGSPLVSRCGRLVGFLILGNPANPHSYYVPAKDALFNLENSSAP